MLHLEGVVVIRPRDMLPATQRASPRAPFLCCCLRAKPEALSCVRKSLVLTMHS